MRTRIACIIALAACGGTPAAPPSPKPPAPVTPVTPVTPATPVARATAFAGRVGVDGGSWTDFVIEGTDDAAHALCDQLVTAEQHELSRVPVTGVYARP